jgi:hypothetical protein
MPEEGESAKTLGSICPRCGRKLVLDPDTNRDDWKDMKPGGIRIMAEAIYDARKEE